VDRRTAILSIMAAACATSLSRPARANEIIGGGFTGGSGSGNLIVGDELTARDAVLQNCVVNGPGAAVRTRAISSTILGANCATDAELENCEISGQYAAHAARLRSVVALGYSSCEFAQVQTGDFDGVYAGHSCLGLELSGVGDSSLSGAIANRSIAHGKNAGAFAEGEDLVMIGADVTTAVVAGPELPVAEIRMEDQTPWIIRNHGFGDPGQRVNLIILAEQMPDTPYGPFTQGKLRPFRVLGPDEIQYTGNKYPAITPGLNVRVAINTNRPKRAVAIGPGSLIARYDQVVVNGQDLTGVISRMEAVEARLKALESIRP
jgi:hypothetical protein